MKRSTVVVLVLFTVALVLVVFALDKTDYPPINAEAKPVVAERQVSDNMTKEEFVEYCATLLPGRDPQNVLYGDLGAARQLCSCVHDKVVDVHTINNDKLEEMLQTCTYSLIND